MTRVLVTGATGLVGGATLRTLAQSDADAVAYVRDPSRLTDLEADVEVHAGDLRDGARLAEALGGVDAVVLVSGHGADMADVQQSALATIAASGVRRVVKISGSPVAMAADASTMGRAHLLAERALRSAVPEPIVVRPSVFMQNLLAMAPAIAHGVLPGPAGDPTVSFVDAADVGRAAAAAALSTSARSLIEITGPEAASYAAVAQTLTELLDRPVAYAPIPVDVMRQGLEAAGGSAWLAEHKVEMAGLMGTPQAALITDHFTELVGEAPTTLRAFLRAHAGELQVAG